MRSSRNRKLVIVEKYEDQKRYEKDAGRKASAGYEIAHVGSEPRRRGCIRFALFGFLNPKPQPWIVVTYRLKQD